MTKTIHDLVAFQRALDLTESVYQVSAGFPTDERFGLTAQIRRASVGVVSQVSEGQGRITYGEWRQLLSQARGSLYEVEAQAIVAHRLKFLSDSDFGTVVKHIRKTGSALAGLIRWVRAREKDKQPGNRATQQPS